MTCLMCRVERICSTCALSLFDHGRWQYCQRVGLVVAEDAENDCWQPLFLPGPDGPEIFGGMDDRYGV